MQGCWAACLQNVGRNAVGNALRCVMDRVARQEGPPLGFSLKGKTIAEADRHLFRQGGSASLEGPTDGVRQVVAFERECLRDHPEVIEILHAAVRDAERHDRFSLLGDDRFRRISAQDGRGRVEKGRVFDSRLAQA